VSYQPTARTAGEIQLVRQPIFDDAGVVKAYQLLTRTDSLMDVFASLDESEAAKKLLSDVFLEMDVWSLTAGLPAYVRFPVELLVNQVPGALPVDLTVLQLTDDAEATPELIDALAELGSMGYRLAIGGLSDRNLRDELRDWADVLKVDVTRVSVPAQHRLIREAHKAGKTVIAENVDSRQQESSARLLGYDGYQGRFFQQPSLVTSRRLAGSRVAYLELLRVANARVIDYDEVAEVIKRDVALAWKFLNYINAAFFGWRQRVESINHGIVLLGERGVRRWVSLIVVSETGADLPRALVTDAICRARFCERLCERLSERTGWDRGDAASPSPLGGFLTGMFSLLDAMMGEPLVDILDNVSLPQDVSGAILTGEGPLGEVLGLVVSYERGAWATVEGRADALGLSTAELTSLYLDALSWARTTLEAHDLATS
jgi:c-di-GMP-related signal transduction protein